MEKKKLPIGIQEFPDFHSENYLYVDKTESIYNLLTTGKNYFLSRPRRFGKSLLLSTLKAIFQGKKELFEGLWIENKWDWTKTAPVIHLSFTSTDYQYHSLEEGISLDLHRIAKEHGITLSSAGFKEQFKELLSSVYQQQGRVALLIDEYDKPIIDYLEYEKLPQAKIHQTVMKSFYSVLKDAAPYLHFIFITGVSKFSQVSIFSDLNHLNDLTLHANYTTLTGYTQEELEFYFDDYLQAASERLKISRADLRERMREWYNGFSWDGINKVYNPFGTLQFLEQHNFRNFWATTGTPTFLLEEMKKHQKFDFENTVTSSDLLSKYDLDNLDLTALLFQTGYLTIKDYDYLNDAIRLDYPNREVRTSFYGFLLNGLMPRRTLAPAAITITDLQKVFLSNQLDKVKHIIGTLFSDLPYDLYERKDDKKKEIEVSERFFHGTIHLIFKYLGVFIQSEVHSSNGRADSIVETPTHIYIFEFKYNRSGKAAMAQLKKNNYADAYLTSGKTLIGIGVNFSHTTRKINGWEIADL